MRLLLLEVKVDKHFQAIRKKKVSLLKSKMVKCLGQGMKTLNISQKRKRDHHAIKVQYFDIHDHKVHRVVGRRHVNAR